MALLIGVQIKVATFSDNSPPGKPELDPPSRPENRHRWRGSRQSTMRPPDPPVST
jgi:hypothetical protein